MKFTECNLKGILIIEPNLYKDKRGFFLEIFQQDRYQALGIKDIFLQDNHSRSMRNVIRGFHFTKNTKQSQILTVVRGRIFDVIVDIREGSSTFGQWFGIELSDDATRQIYMPHGFAHGFCVLSDYADLHYKVSAKYDTSCEGGFRWDDPNIAVDWPICNPIVSDRDIEHPYFNEIFNL
jgi:dTDP-4-dehydrorhamnose 3,5-epimerase